MTKRKLSCQEGQHFVQRYVVCAVSIYVALLITVCTNSNCNCDEILNLSCADVVCIHELFTLVNVAVLTISCKFADSHGSELAHNATRG